jgi:hypothetical protein
MAENISALKSLLIRSFLKYKIFWKFIPGVSNMQPADINVGVFGFIQPKYPGLF